MKTYWLILALTLAALVCPAAQPQDSRCYEMRVYYPAPGKMAALQSRFRDHTCKLFEKHGMINLGYWTPLTNAELKLVYVLAYPSRAAREASWKAFSTDPEWTKVARESEREGRLVAKVESIFLAATDFSPAIQPTSATPPRAFELRTYTAGPGNLNALLARFRDHTLALFRKHGMTSFAYWTPTEPKDGAGEKLVYLLIHPGKEAADAAFAAFRADPDWVAAKKASEDKAGGPLTTSVVSEFLTPTDFSPSR